MKFDFDTNKSKIYMSPKQAKQYIEKHWNDINLHLIDWNGCSASLSDKALENLKVTYKSKLLIEGLPETLEILNFLK